MRKRSEAIPPPLPPEPAKTDPAPPPAGILFVHHLGGGFDQVVERIFDLPDAFGQYQILEHALKLGDERTDVGSLSKALDEAEEHARIAHQIFVNARVEAELWDREADVVRAPMWKRANAELQEEKEKGTRSKMITDRDVDLRVADLFPDEYRATAVRAAKIKGMVDHARKLSELWTQRCSTLQTLLSNRRK